MNIALVEEIKRRTDEHIGVLEKGKKYKLSFFMQARNPIKIELVDDVTNEMIQRVNKNTDFRNGRYIYGFSAMRDGNLFMKIGGQENTKITEITLEVQE